jgi:uncharacterized protein (DUF305 family)
MENKNQVLIIGLLALIVGLLFGYFFGSNAVPNRGSFSSESMFEEMEEHMFGDEIVDGDGELQHMMSEMMLIGRGQTGAAYERAWLRGMVVHHLGAIEMSKDLLKKTSRPELVALANNIIKSQSAEVGQMKEWLNRWFDEN